MDFKKIWQIYIDTIIKIVPKPPLPAAVGIDIGTRRIKVVELARCQSGFELRAFKIESFDPANVSAVIKNLLEGFNIENKTLITSVSGKGTLIRYVDVPRMTNEELRKSLAYELDKYFPFDPTTIYYDSHIIDEQIQDKKMAALITAVKKDLVDEKLKIFKQAGFELNKVTTNAIATANAFSQLTQTTDELEGAKALLDIGGSLSNLMIINNGSPRFTRDIFIGANDFTKQIANIFGVDHGKAEQMKMQADNSEEILRACEDTLTNLIGEVRLSLEYFITEKNINVNGLYLVGGGSQMSGLVPILEKQLGLPVKVWQTLSGLKFASTINQDHIEKEVPELAVALGLALSGL